MGAKLWVALASVVFMAVGLTMVLTLVVGSFPAWSQAQGLANLVGSHWQPLDHHFGLAPFFVGTVTVSVTALVIDVPFALAVAITLSEILVGKPRELARRLLAVLTAVPSVLFGWWGLQYVVPWVRATFGGAGFSLLAAGLVLAFMLLPTSSLLFMGALAHVPKTYKEASLALGATSDQTLVRMILPGAVPSLLQGLVVSFGRAIGETMAVQMVIGGQTAMPSGLTHPGATLTTQILTDMTVFPPGTPEHAALDAMAVVLLLGMYLLVRLSEVWGGRL